MKTLNVVVVLSLLAGFSFAAEEKKAGVAHSDVKAGVTDSTSTDRKLEASKLSDADRKRLETAVDACMVDLGAPKTR